MEIYECVVCEKYGIAKANNITIPKMPKSTFQITEETLDLEIGECVYCGAVQLFNTPLSEDYLDVYRSIGISKELRQAKTEQLKIFLEKYHLQNKIMLEVGCGDGQILEIFKSLGKDVYGIETNTIQYNTCTNKGFHVENQSVYSDFGMWEAFGCFHVLEHIPDPQEFLSILNQHIYTNAIGIIEIPNYDYIEANHIWLEFTKDHRVYYHKRTLEYLLTSCGFEILEMEENTYDRLVLTVMVRKPMISQLILMKDQFCKDILEFETFCNALPQPFAIYGAGHYCQLMLNNTHVKPNHIFDSNKDKCGKPLSGIIVEHKTAMKEDFKSILVMCGIYNSEVVTMLKQMNLKQEIIAWKN